MASDIILSSAVRNNLLSLQKTADLLSSTQEKLATGLKVNSALDDPTAFFTASALNSRASDLNRLQDFVGNAVQTIKTADEGITSITELVENAEAVARQALQKTAQTSQDIAKITGSIDIADDAAAATVATSAVSADATSIADIEGAAAVSGTQSLASAGFAAGDLITVTINEVQTVFTIDASTATSATTTDGILTLGDDLSDLYLEVANLSAEVSTTVTASAGQTASLIFTTSVENFAIEFTDASSTTATAAQVLAVAAGLDVASGTTGAGSVDGAVSGYLNSDLGELTGTVTFEINGETDSITFGYGAGEVNTQADLATALSTLNSSNNTGATFTFTGSDIINVTASSISDGEIEVTVTGASSTDIATAIGLTDQTDGVNSTIDDLIASNSGADETLVISDGTNTDTLTFGYDSGEISNRADLVTAVFESLANTGARLTVDDDDNLIVVGGEADEITISGTNSNAAATAFGLSTTATASSTQDYNNADREGFAVTYNGLLAQIDALAADTTFNGVNLLQSANLTVAFNESGSSSLSISGVDFDSDGLSINGAVSKFETDANIDTALDELENAKNTLQSQAAAFGSNLSVVEIRQDFTKALINVLETGAANLTLADTNQEGANLLALQTRSSLSSTALSLASQADQQVLRLF